MPRAKTLDRLELTKRSSAYLRNRDGKRTHVTISDISPDDIPPTLTYTRSVMSARCADSIR